MNNLYNSSFAPHIIRDTTLMLFNDVMINAHTLAICHLYNVVLQNYYKT
jgi:hypothetical protein